MRQKVRMLYMEKSRYLVLGQILHPMNSTAFRWQKTSKYENYNSCWEKKYDNYHKSSRFIWTVKTGDGDDDAGRWYFNCNLSNWGFTVSFNNMRALTGKAQPTNAFFATLNQMLGDSSQFSRTTAERAVIKSLCTVQTTKQCSAIVRSWEESRKTNLLVELCY